MQVGRAGRDGTEARCYLFLDDADYQRLRSLSASGGVELRAVQAFARRIFPGAAPAAASDGEAPGQAANNGQSMHATA